VFLYSLYWKGSSFEITPHFKRYTENNSSVSETVRISAPQMHFWMNNYNCQALARFPISCITSCLWSVKINRKEMPKILKEHKPQRVEATV
jgi:hypothetical protein